MKFLVMFPQATLYPGCDDVGILRKGMKFTKAIEGIF
jgi:hypothetical protein